jgi:hypothetical protein
MATKARFFRVSDSAHRQREYRHDPRCRFHDGLRQPAAGPTLRRASTCALMRIKFAEDRLRIIRKCRARPQRVSTARARAGSFLEVRQCERASIPARTSLRKCA